MASFVASRVALPKVVSNAPLLEEILPEQYQNLFKADSDMLRTQIEVDTLNEALGQPVFTTTLGCRGRRPHTEPLSAKA